MAKDWPASVNRRALPGGARDRSPAPLSSPPDTHDRQSERADARLVEADGTVRPRGSVADHHRYRGACALALLDVRTVELADHAASAGDSHCAVFRSRDAHVLDFGTNVI